MRTWTNAPTWTPPARVLVVCAAFDAALVACVLWLVR